MIDVSEFDKDQLAEYAKNVFSVDLDMRKGIDKLRSEVKALQSKPEKAKEKPKNPNATHIRNNETGTIFPYTALLKGYLPNATDCDENGNSV